MGLFPMRELSAMADGFKSSLAKMSAELNAKLEEIRSVLIEIRDSTPRD